MFKRIINNKNLINKYFWIYYSIFSELYYGKSFLTFRNIYILITCDLARRKEIQLRIRLLPSIIQVEQAKLEHLFVFQTNFKTV